MPDGPLKQLTSQGLSRLLLDADEWESLRDRREAGTRFSLTFPHAVARNARKNQLVLIGIEGAPLHIGLVRSIARVASLNSRVVFDFVRPARPASLDVLLAQVNETALKAPTGKLASDPTPLLGVSERLAEKLASIIAGDPYNRVALTRMIAHVTRPKKFTDARALQQDAVALAIKAFGGDGAAADLALPGGDTALATVRVHEDAVIENDARWIPGWHLSDSDLTGRATFERGRDRLDVYTANKRALEQLLGVDLIYFNERRAALVLVQYKIMEPNRRSEVSFFDAPGLYEGEVEGEWTVAIDDQFLDEIARMHDFDKDLSPDGPYRLNPGGFYFKLVRRHASASSAGLMLSLEHLTTLMASNALTGPRGGLRLSYQGLDGHYLRANGFVELVHSGYIGTRGATTEHLRVLIDAALNAGRGVVAAIQSRMPDTR